MFEEPLIPGQTPLDDLSGLRDRSIRTRAQCDAAEAANILKAVQAYLLAAPSARSAPFTVAWSRRLHHRMFGEVWTWAGRLRTTQTSIGCAPHEIEPRLCELLDDLHAWSRLPAPMRLSEQAVRLHHRAVLIHPFTNGNGRWARMMANIWLRLHRSPVVAWPDESVNRASPIRGEYIAAIRAADAGDTAPLAALHERFTDRSGLS